MRCIIVLLFVCSWSASLGAATTAVAVRDTAELDFAEMLNSHILDEHVWHIFDGGTVYLPVIIYSGGSLAIFSAHHFFDKDHQLVSYRGYRLVGREVVSLSGQSVWDFSLTKTVLFLLIEAILLVIALVWVARRYSRHRVPSGLQNAIEAVVLFVRDEIVRPCMGSKADRYLPYLLTLFFFILVGNLMGLLPGAANLNWQHCCDDDFSGFHFYYYQCTGQGALLAACI